MQIFSVENSVRRYARSYAQARSAIMNLGPNDEEKRRYQPLTRDQLKVSTARLDPSERDSHNSQLAWFWTVDIRGDLDVRKGMNEC